MIRFVLNHIPRKLLQKVSDKLIPAVAFFYRGNNIVCPICGKGFRKILPYGYVTLRKNALCPCCLSLERHRMIWYYLHRETNFANAPLKMLHIAPEHAFIKRFDTILSRNKGQYITADIESPLAKVKMDVQQIPFDAESFDVIMCNHVLEHVESDKKALEELYRVLKKGGWGILLSPVDLSRETTYENSAITLPEERLEHFGQKDHVRVYGRDYPQRLSDAGFEVTQIDYAASLPSNEFRKMAFSNEVLYIVKK